MVTIYSTFATPKPHILSHSWKSYLRSSASCNVRKKKDFLVNGMQNTAHNAALLQLLQRLVSGQDNEMTACGVKGGGAVQLPSLLWAGRRPIDTFFFSYLHTAPRCVHLVFRSVGFKTSQPKSNNSLRCFGFLLSDRETYCSCLCFV